MCHLSFAAHRLSEMRPPTPTHCVTGTGCWVFLANHHHRAIMIDFGRSFVDAVLQLHVERGSAKHPMFSSPLAMPCTVVLW